LPLSIRTIEDSSSVKVIVEGDLNRDNIDEFESRMRSIRFDPGHKIILDLSALDIEDGLTMATTINALRELRSRTSGLILKGAPQMLGHNLYRVGLLNGPAAIVLVDMREDEPAGF